MNKEEARQNLEKLEADAEKDFRGSFPSQQSRSLAEWLVIRGALSLIDEGGVDIDMLVDTVRQCR